MGDPGSLSVGPEDVRGGHSGEGCRLGVSSWDLGAQDLAPPLSVLQASVGQEEEERFVSI